MNWRIEVKPTAEKQYSRLDRKRQRIKEALRGLESVKELASHSGVKALTGATTGFESGIGGSSSLLNAGRG